MVPGPVADASPTRGRPRREGVDAEVVGAACEILGEHGIAGMSMDLVAQRAGVSKATIYRRWASKEQLVVDVMRSFSQPIPVPDTGTLAADLTQYLEQVIEVFRSQKRNDILPHLIAAACYDDTLRASLHDYSRSRQVPLRTILHRAVRRGELPAGFDVDIAVDMLMGAFLYRRLMSTETPTRPMAKRLVAMLLTAG